jgi:hypothetical protein
MAPLRDVVRLVLCVCGLSLLPAVARGQGGDSGSIIGYVYDQAGNPIRGVKITASSSTQIGGAKVTYTDDEGAFRLRALIPGTFEVQAAAPTLQTVIQKDVRVGITAAAELNLIMQVETAVERVTVVQKAPLVSTTKPNIKEEFDSDFVESLPHRTRDNIHRDMLTSVPGVVVNRMRGGSANQTLFTQDGFDMRTPGGGGISPALKTSAAFEIQTAGYGADNPTASGGILNLVTRSGSNKWEFEFNATADASQLRFFRDQRDPRVDTFYYVLNPTVSGPIIKDKLWFFFNTETHLTSDGRQRDIEGIFPDPLPRERFIQKGSVKLTWQITARNKLSAITNYELPYEINRIDGVGVAPEAQEIRFTQRWFGGMIWESLLSDKLLLRSQVGTTFIPEHIYPSRCRTEPVDCDHIPQVLQTFPRQQRLENNGNHSSTDILSFQTFNQLDYFADSKALGEHNFQLKDRFYTERETRRQSRPGDALYELQGNDPFALTSYYSNDPRYEEPRYGWWIASHTLSKNIATLSDTWRVTRYLTVTPALSHVWARGDNSRGDNVINTSTWAPGASAVWDPTRDGRTALRGSFSTYVDVDVAPISRHTLGSQAQRRCRWNPSTSAYDTGCVFTGGLSTNTIGRPCGPDGTNLDGTDCTTPLEVPRTWEYTLGGEREVVQGVALSLDLVHRQFSNQYEINETNRIWNPSGTAIEPSGGYRNGRAETILDLGAPDGAQRRYTGVTFGITKREGRLKSRATYTWSRLRGTVFNSSNNPWGDIPGRDIYLDGMLPDDHPHEIKIILSYQATPWLSFGTRTTYMSGMPYERLFRNDETAAFDQYRARRGTNPGANINDPADDRELRLPDQLEANFQARFNLMPLLGQRLDLYADVLNVLALRTATAVGQNEGQDFAVERSWLDPFRVRIGLDYKF